MTTNSRTPAKRTSSRATAPQQNGNTDSSTAGEPEAPKFAPQREAEGVDTVEIEWRGLKFEIISDIDKWNYWTVMVPLAHGNETRALLGLLGPAQTETLRQAMPGLLPPDARDLFETINDALGLNSGN